MCTVLLPPGVKIISVKCIISYRTLNWTPLSFRRLFKSSKDLTTTYWPNWAVVFHSWRWTARSWVHHLVTSIWVKNDCLLLYVFTRRAIRVYITLINYTAVYIPKVSVKINFMCRRVSLGMNSADSNVPDVTTDETFWIRQMLEKTKRLSI
jgi:hypothetical protein